MKFILLIVISILAVNFNGLYATEDFYENLKDEILVDSIEDELDLTNLKESSDEQNSDEEKHSKSEKRSLKSMKRIFMELFNRKNVSIYYVKVPLNNGDFVFVPKDVARNHYFPG